MDMESRSLNPSIRALYFYKGVDPTIRRLRTRDHRCSGETHRVLWMPIIFTDIRSFETLSTRNRIEYRRERIIFLSFEQIQCRDIYIYIYTYREFSFPKKLMYIQLNVNNDRREVKGN